MQKSLALLTVAAIALVAIATAGMQSGDASKQTVPPAVVGTATARGETTAPAAQTVTAEQAAAMMAGTCHLRCPADPSARSAVSCHRVSRNECQQIAAANQSCRADYIPAMWCSPRALATE